MRCTRDTKSVASFIVKLRSTMAQIAMVPLISYTGLQQPILLDTITIDERINVPLPKGDRRVERLLVAGREGRNRTESRVLSRTDVLETLLKLRANKYKELVQSAKAQAVGAPKISTGLNAESDDGPLSRRQASLLKQAAPTVAYVDAPTIGPINGVPISVKLESHSNPPIVIELTVASVDYVVSAASYQIDNSDVKHVRRARCQLAPGVSRIYVGPNKGKYRMSVVDKNGQKRRLCFTAETDQRAIERGVLLSVGRKGIAGSSDVEEEEEEADECMDE